MTKAKRPGISLLMTAEWPKTIFSEEDLAALNALGEVVAETHGELDEATQVRLARGADAILTCWGSPPLTPAVLEAAPEVGIICHCAGTVKPYIDPISWPIIWERGIAVTNTAAALGTGVAEYTLGLIITSLKKVFFMRDEIAAGQWHEVRHLSSDPYHVTVGIVGAGHCGRHVITLLQNFDITVLICDPYKDAEQWRQLGGVKVELDALFSQADVISLHAPDIPQNRGMITRELLAKIKDGAVLINTARGILLDEPALIDELRAGRFYACLDVTEPEPPSADNPLRTLKNVFLTPHIAGHASNGMKRQGRFALEELQRFFAGQPLRYRIRKEQMDIIA